ncbi:neurogenic locus notch homolog protein 1-like [Saccostrea cucullata]|uniref:neurogenic locus notch homolog protein 1-like n=1 Tax=Saccostrea cuccullata TaxID=36930 RepID=UPI002ED4323F
MIILTTVLFPIAASQDLQKRHISLIIENVDYKPGMEENMSREFKDLADTLCVEFSGMFSNTEVQKGRQHQEDACHVDSLRKTTAGKVEVRLTLENLNQKITETEDGLLNTILQNSKHLTEDGKALIDINKNLIPISSIHITNSPESGPQISNPLLESERLRRTVNTSPTPLVSEGSKVVTTTPKPPVTTVEIVWATNWWDVFLSRYNWGGTEEIFGPDTGSTLSRLPEVDNCLMEDPCQNGGKCVSDEVSYSCVCTEGWTGQHCDRDLDECRRNPCNGRPCTNTLGSYRCECPSGYTGTDCTHDLDECENSPCQNNGVCTNTQGSFTCECQQGWTSTTCEEDLNECLTNPCKEGSRCVNNKGSYTCECDIGWEGTNCTKDLDECENSPCQNNGVCTNTQGSFTCECQQGWTSTNCEEDLNECLTNPCKEGSRCVNNKGSYTCECDIGWEGTNCTKDLDECENSPCQNNGVCTNTQGSFTCECQQGWTSTTCEEDLNECLTNPCKEGSRCVNNKGSYTCECDIGWEGKNCAEDIDECKNQQPCANGGLCKNTDGSFECTCVPGWTGGNCTADVDECLNSPCGEGVPCFNTEGSYSCKCPPGWTGKNCTEDEDECLGDSELCSNGGICNNTAGAFKCECSSGWTGKLCDQDVDECVESPCPEGSSCVNLIGSFTCECMEGWTGQYCETDVDECLLTDCGNGGTCLNFNGSYGCDCSPGFTGTPCEDVDECQDSPCSNGAACENIHGSFVCKCDSGWEGKQCDEDVDECVQNPCSNGGVCQNVDGSYQCDCPQPWVGQDCTARMFLMGAEGQFGSSVTISCGVQRLETWNSIEVKYGNRTLYQVNPDGLFTDFTGGGVKINSSVVGSGADVSLTFQNLRCEDEGKYQCTVDGNSKNTMNLVVTKPPSGEPTRISKTEGVVDNRRTINIQCQGHPSYPYGNLKFQVKQQNEAVYRDFQFPVQVQDDLTADCSRTQTMSVDYNFGQEWDQATIRCIEEESGNFDETVIDVLPDNFCERASTVTEIFLEHPHNPKKYVQCLNQLPRAVMECDVDTCFNENEQQCGSCVKECQINLCKNKASCWIINGILSCQCPSGWSGSLCEMDEDECISSPCLHGGSCYNLPGTYMCNCTAGWQGPLCDMDVDECLMNPCANGGQCTNTIASYTCACSPGWTGKQCDTDIDECLYSPCQNGGTCVNEPGAYSCTCPSGWTGAYCEQDVDECLLNPCINGGSCTNLIGSFSCDCPQPWFGKICESGLFVDGHRGEIGSENVTAVTCSVFNYQDWKRLDIIRSDKRNRSVVRVTPNGGANSVFNKRNVQVIYTPGNAQQPAEVSLQFTRLRCRDEGVYKCVLDNGQNQDAKIIVTNPSRGKPVISKIEELYGEANIAFNCTGYPGYPDGDLQFQVKLQNETAFHDFTFYSATRENVDLGCVRKQTVNATYFMNMEWNRAKIRCKARGSEQFDETNVYLLSPEICAAVPLNKGIRHPYNKEKYITCTREAPKVRNCPNTTCFDDRSQQCLFTCDNDD